jgi:hypothetical protein
MIGGRNNMNKTVLIIGIIFLLIGASVVTSTGTIVEDTHIDYHSMDSIDVSKELLPRGKIAFGIEAFSPYALVKFSLDDLSNYSTIASGDFTYFPIGGTWSCNDIWYVCEYNSGALWKIDPFTGEQENIGGGGTSVNGLTYSPLNHKLYGAGIGGLYEYDPETGEQVYIGSYGISNTMNGIAINSKGECYAWAYNFNGTSTLYTIDLETGKATEVGTLNIPGGDGHFDYETGMLYMSGLQLVKVNLDTWNCTIIGHFGTEIYCLAIPYNCSYLSPVTTISFGPPYPDGENDWYVSNVTATLNATDTDGVDATYYRINSGDWNIYYSPFIISEEGDDVLIEYYSIDNAGNVEDVKYAYLDMDKTPPNITLDIEVKRIGWRKWLLTVILNCTDNTSGMDRVEFFLNEGLQSVVSGSGPTYGWSVVIKPGGIIIDIKCIAYDIAGNYGVGFVNSSDISYQNKNKDTFTQQSTCPLIIRLLERLPLLERFLNSIQRG